MQGLDVLLKAAIDEERTGKYNTIIVDESWAPYIPLLLEENKPMYSIRDKKEDHNLIQENKPTNVSIEYELYWKLKKLAVDRKMPLRKMIHKILQGHLDGLEDQYYAAPTE